MNPRQRLQVIAPLLLKSLTRKSPTFHSDHLLITAIQHKKQYHKITHVQYKGVCHSAAYTDL